MIEDVIREYGKLMDWFLEEYPNETIELNLKNNTKNNTIEFCISFTDGTDQLRNAQYFDKTWIGTQMGGDIKNQILSKGKYQIRNRKRNINGNQS